MANVHWGVDSAAAVNHKVAVDGNKHMTLYEFVVSRLKREPEFWGAYIGGKYEITQERLDYIAKASNGKCRILIVYNGARNTPNSVQGDYKAGVNDAAKAIAAAQRIGVPGGVMIWGDVEGAWTPTADWFLGWFDTMYASKYAGMGGIYCRPNIEQFYKPYTEALKRSLPGPRIRVTAPVPVGAGASAAGQARTFTTDRYVKVMLTDNFAFIPPDPPDMTRLLWGTRPQRRDWKNPATDPLAFSAKEPANPPRLPDRVALWQYYIDFLKPTTTSHYGLIDMDLADDRAHDLMWKL